MRLNNWLAYIHEEGYVKHGKVFLYSIFIVKISLIKDIQLTFQVN